MSKRKIPTPTPLPKLKPAHSEKCMTCGKNYEEYLRCDGPDCMMRSEERLLDAREEREAQE